MKRQWKMSFMGMLSLLLVCWRLTTVHSWGWFSSSDQSSRSDPTTEMQQAERRRDAFTKFDAESLEVLGSDSRGKNLAEKASFLASEHSCWQNAYAGMRSNCRDILRNENEKARLALRLTDCFLKVTGRPVTKHCPEHSPVLGCTKLLNDHTHSIFLAYFIDIASMCHYFQLTSWSQQFKLETESIVNQLKGSAHWLEGKLQDIQLQLTDQHETNLAYSEEIASAQKTLQTAYTILQEQIEAGMTTLTAAAREAEGQLWQIGQTQKEIAGEQQKLAETLAGELVELKTKTVDVSDTVTHLSETMGELTRKSLAGQAQLLAGQERAMEGMNTLQQEQSAAFHENRDSMQELASEAHKHQREFRDWQEELNQAHQRLADGSKAILKSQDLFMTNQAVVFSSLERLFSLHNSILSESKTIKIVFFYVTMATTLFFATATNQTHKCRISLYSGLFFTFLIEIWIGSHTQLNKPHDQPRRSILSMVPVGWVRWLFSGFALYCIIHGIITYRDYTELSYNILKELQQNYNNKSIHPKDALACEACSIAQMRQLTPYEKNLAKKIVKKARTSRRRAL